MSSGLGGTLTAPARHAGGAGTACVTRHKQPAMQALGSAAHQPGAEVCPRLHPERRQRLQQFVIVLGQGETLSPHLHQLYAFTPGGVLYEAKQLGSIVCSGQGERRGCWMWWQAGGLGWWKGADGWQAGLAACSACMAVASCWPPSPPLHLSAGAQSCSACAGQSTGRGHGETVTALCEGPGRPDANIWPGQGCCRHGGAAHHPVGHWAHSHSPEGVPNHGNRAV